MIGRLLAAMELSRVYAALFVTSGAGVVAFISADTFTKSLPIAIVCQSFATIAGAWLLSRPKLASVRSSHEINLLQELQRERSDNGRFLIERLQQQNKLIAALTITKHGLASELQSLMFQVELLSDMLTQRSIEHPKLKVRTFLEMTREEDKIRADIIGLDSDFVDKQYDKQYGETPSAEK